MIIKTIENKTRTNNQKTIEIKTRTNNQKTIKLHGEPNIIVLTK